MKKGHTTDTSGNTMVLKQLNRREIIKGLATIPVLGAFIYALFKKINYDNLLKNVLSKELEISGEEPEPVILSSSSGKKIRLGMIGFGTRGEQLARALGYVHPEIIDEWKKAALEDKNDNWYSDFLEQDDLNIVINGICDVFEVRAQRAMIASANAAREGNNGKSGKAAHRYRTYNELIAAEDIDAVIIATPDHWHAQMAIDAAKAGKHVYLEKGMTRTASETFMLRKAIKDTGIIFQLGHQGRQTDSYRKAREILQKDILGKISIVEVCTNRNDPNGAWVYDIHPEASPDTIDWKQFIGPTNWHPFSPERFFRWRCWWDYGTGLAGDLLTHEYDAVNQVLDLGIPHSAVASGGIYYYKDGREVPDVFHAVFEYPHRDLVLVYSASLSSERFRGKVIMGHDGHMEMENTLTVYADKNSTRYQEKIEQSIINPEVPMFTYIPGRKNIDAVVSPTEQYFASRGLLYTYLGGKRYDT
ncbi:MAG TPA: Gfo/Idh/MocA family oxidoreductase, partial [Bacteroidales bacterium]|nr:Gfo/Idh/MocA family oxidoreductase [Bacteroidales bacterium]